ncbi:hypothetical protein DIPPA_03627 [Diplonema papillatum]|nr:hypothetical protein DIPPA_03627 [Diplonema papillatum]
MHAYEGRGVDLLNYVSLREHDSTLALLEARDTEPGGVQCDATGMQMLEAMEKGDLRLLRKLAGADYEELKSLAGRMFHEQPLREEEPAEFSDEEEEEDDEAGRDEEKRRAAEAPRRRIEPQYTPEAISAASTRSTTAFTTPEICFDDREPSFGMSPVVHAAPAEGRPRSSLQPRATDEPAAGDTRRLPLPRAGSAPGTLAPGAEASRPAVDASSAALPRAGSAPGALFPSATAPRPTAGAIAIHPSDHSTAPVASPKRGEHDERSQAHAYLQGNALGYRRTASEALDAAALLQQQQQQPPHSEQKRHDPLCLPGGAESPSRKGKAGELPPVAAAGPVNGGMTPAGNGLHCIKSLRKERPSASFVDAWSGCLVTMTAGDGEILVTVNRWTTTTDCLHLDEATVQLPNGSQWEIMQNPPTDVTAALVKIGDESRVPVIFRSPGRSPAAPPSPLDPSGAAGASDEERLRRQKEYIKGHKVHLLLGDALYSCLRELPPDPYCYLAKALLRGAGAGRRELAGKDSLPGVVDDVWSVSPDCKLTALEAEVQRLRQMLAQSHDEQMLESEVGVLRQQVARNCTGRESLRPATPACAAE